MLRTAESLRRSVVDTGKHPLTPPYASLLSTDEIDQLVAYLASLRAIPPSYPCERTRTIPPASENAAFFDRPERAGEEASDALVNALEIREGARVADVGAGTGYFTWRLAQRVGATGKVTAVDIQPRMLELASAAVKTHGLLTSTTSSGRRPTRSCRRNHSTSFSSRTPTTSSRSPRPSWRPSADR